MNVMYKTENFAKKAKNYDFVMSFQNIKSRKYFLCQNYSAECFQNSMKICLYYSALLWYFFFLNQLTDFILTLMLSLPHLTVVFSSLAFVQKEKRWKFKKLKKDMFKNP